MEPIKIYTDETYGDDHNYCLTTSIYGSGTNCKDFEEEIEKIVNANISLLGKDFKGFHASKLGINNWDRISPIFEAVVLKLKEFLATKRLQLLVHIESNKTYESNSKYLEDLLERNITDPASSLGEIFQHISHSDLIPIYKRAPKLYNFLLHRGKFGSGGQEFEYYPDSSGKIMKYKNLKFKIQTSSNFGIRPLIIEEDFFEIIKFTGNGLVSALIKTGWNQFPLQTLKVFQPITDEESFVLQAADIISNFTYNLIKKAAGDVDDIVLKKGGLLTKNGIFDDIESELSKAFEIKENKTVLKSEEFKQNIEIR